MRRSHDPLPSPDRDLTEGAVEPETLSEWFPVFRDFAVVIVALSLLVYEAAFTTPNEIIIASIGAILVYPSAIRFQNRKPTGGKDD